ncbi:MAG: flagellar basal body-associated FliL family protein, partial [Betaproteobacteria bacterium]|nr:flagellar basal body-associated FliL family protein [Betaproteobacteria bacterium]
DAKLSAQPIFVPLDPFTVNLQREQGDQVLQVGLSLKFYNQDLSEKLKNAMPEIRSSLLLLLSSKYASELLTVDGKKKLAGEIIVAVNTILGIPTAVQHPKTEAAKAPVAAPAATTPPAAGDAATQPSQAPAQDTAAPAGAAGAPAEPGTAVAAQTPASAPAAQGTSAEDASEKNRDGIADVLFTSFIIQ